MSQYKEIIYPTDNNNPYPRQLAEYLYKEFIEKVYPAGIKKILDIGCSSGNILEAFQSVSTNRLDCYGIDVRDENNNQIKFKKCNLETDNIPFQDNYFDIIFSKSVIEHVINSDNFIKETHRVLKPGGIFICMCPSWESQYKYFYDDYTHVKPWTRKGLRDALLIHEYSNVSCNYFYQLPIVWKYPWIKYFCRFLDFVLPDSFKWKTSEQRNTKDIKFIRFSKELMLLATASKE